uniref:Oxidored_molyb domain-containing protein n=1 Tax=Heterorhabditis bacteriophora TaxID=37862 RepID=A0A1I7WYB6_HETBA
MEILETLRIGNLDPKDADEMKKTDSSNPFSTDPIRHPALIVNNEKPFNAETPPLLLVDHFCTPNELFFVRNHLPVPQIDVEDHRLLIEGIGVKQPIELSVDDLKKNYQAVSVTSVIQCAGNRRADMNKYKKVQGLMWEGTAISNAKWTGVRLRVQFYYIINFSVLTSLISLMFIILGFADFSQPYGASIPFEKAISPETIIAYSMNDEDIPSDHGFPLRCVVPGEHMWAWTLFRSTINIPENVDKFELVVKATDR